MAVQIIVGDCRNVLPTLPSSSVQCCVTSPPYWGLRDYGMAAQIGAEPRLNEFVEQLTAVFREVRRVLRDDGTLWLNLGDAYAANGGAHGGRGDNQRGVGARRVHMAGAGDQSSRRAPAGFKAKDLLGLPWRIAFALQSDGWFLRQDIIWHKPNPMPESVRDRCTKSHEYIFMLTKRPRYEFHGDSIREASGSNARSVWSIPTVPFTGAHFATFPPALARRCVLVGSRPGDVVLDPFGGAGTTGLVAADLQRDAIVIELNPDHARIARDRIEAAGGFFSAVRCMEVGAQ